MEFVSSFHKIFWLPEFRVFGFIPSVIASIEIMGFFS
jgi:hypothetical protein